MKPERRIITIEFEFGPFYVGAAVDATTDPGDRDTPGETDYEVHWMELSGYWAPGDPPLALDHAAVEAMALSKAAEEFNDTAPDEREVA